MSKSLEKRILKLETGQNQQLRVEDLLKSCDTGDDAPSIPYVPGENALLDFLHSVGEELAAEECGSSASSPDCMCVEQDGRDQIRTA